MVRGSEEARRLLDPELLSRLRSLHLRARQTADGALTGLHKSPHHGASIEFAEHKEYAPGDEIRHIDWKVFAKSDKYYVKRFEQETNQQAMFLVDASGSMRYQSKDGRLSKWDYAATCAAALGYLLLRQQDSVGLTVVGERVTTYVPPRSRSSHLMALCELLVQNAPQKGVQTNLLAGATHLLEVLKRRGVVFVLSDFLDTERHFFRVLNQLRSRRQRVVLLHILDPWELRFPFEGMTNFRSLETGHALLAEPRAMRKAYLSEVKRFVTSLRESTLESGMEYRLLETDQTLESALTAYLTGRPQARFQNGWDVDGL